MKKYYTNTGNRLESKKAFKFTPDAPPKVTGKTFFTQDPIGNRKNRRSHLNQPREFSNKKGIQLVVLGTGKFKKILQSLPGKTIVHV